MMAKALHGERLHFSALEGMSDKREGDNGQQ